MNCKRCGARLPQGIMVCSECGTRQHRQARWVRCAACHYRVPVELTVCPNCGRFVRPAGPRWGLWLAGVVLIAFAGLWALDRLPIETWSQRATRLQDRVVKLVQIPELPSNAMTPMSTPAIEPVVSVPTAFPTVPDGGLPRTQVPPGLNGTSAPAEASVTSAPAAESTVTPAPSARPTEPLTATFTPTPAPTATAVPSATQAPTATPPPSPTATATPDTNKYYTVRPGESLMMIGIATGIDWQLIAAANNITQATMIHPGDKLILPAPKPASPAAATATPVRVARKYIIQSGDSLAAVGERYGIPWQDIARANNITQRTMLQPGQELLIPGADQPTDTPAPRPTAKPVRPSATSGPGFPAPVLLSPADGTPFTGGSDRFVELTWRRVDGLPPGAVYRVSIQYLSGGAPQQQWWNTTALGMQVPSGLWSAADQPSRQYTWSVQVVQMTTDGKGGERPIPLSSPSASRTFEWH